MSKFTYTDEDMAGIKIIPKSNNHSIESSESNAMTINFTSKETILHSTQHIAELIANKCILQINDASYRIADFEFYIYSKHAEFQDPHTYKNTLQLQSNKLYLHGSGIDITIGDGENYAGILLRSVIKLYAGSKQENGFMKEQIDGSQRVATELFSNFHSLDSHVPNHINLVQVQHNQDACLYPAEYLLKTKRVGLTSKKNDPENVFLNLPLRYVAIVPKFKQKIRNKEALLKEQVVAGTLTQEVANKILGYTKKSK